MPTIDYPEYRDSTTIVRRGDWEIWIAGYTTFIPGDVVSVVGEYTHGKLKAETAIVSQSGRITLIDRGLIVVSKVRQWAILRLQRWLPEPMASLTIGILLGVKRQMPLDFYEALVATGTLHVVAASGYNVAVVGGLLTSFFGSFFARRYATALAIVGIAFYVLLAGASPSIMRAGIMGSLTLIAFYWGRSSEARRLLIITLYMMLMIKPSLVTDIGWQLSVAATLGLLYLSPWLRKLEIRNPKYEAIQKFAVDFFYPTLSATIATAPIIWWHFGRVSLIGLLVNMLILPVVPLIMLLSAITLLFLPMAYMLYVPLWWMVWVIKMFSG